MGTFIVKSKYAKSFGFILSDFLFSTTHFLSENVGSSSVNATCPSCPYAIKLSGSIVTLISSLLIFSTLRTPFILSPGFASYSKLKGEIEDAAFPYVYPKEFKEVTKLLEEKKEAKEKIVKKVEKEIVRKLQSENIQVLKTSSRVKHKYSLWRKLQRHHMDIDKIYDILALRVIVPTIEDCYRALGIVHSMWKPFPERLKDYIALPKLNGYQSLHTTIFNGEGALIEVQIRTMEMHGLAEYGIASHFAYKEFINKNGKKKPTQDGKYAWIKQFQNIKDANEKADAFMKDLKMDFFNDRIFIFTPKGDVLDLPADSSPIDFAYGIHTDIGDHCSGAIVNGKMVPLSKKLQSGDIVDIITKENSKPTSKWLDYVKTALAKKHIKSKVGDNGFLASLWGRFTNQ